MYRIYYKLLQWTPFDCQSVGSFYSEVLHISKLVLNWNKIPYLQTYWKYFRCSKPWSWSDVPFGAVISWSQAAHCRPIQTGTSYKHCRTTPKGGNFGINFLSEVVQLCPLKRPSSVWTATSSLHHSWDSVSGCSQVLRLGAALFRMLLKWHVPGGLAGRNVKFSLILQ